LYKIKEKPEHFIVSEVSDIKVIKNGNFYLYLLIKKNYNTLYLSEKYKLSYAGLKDKKAITFQYVSSNVDYGEIFKHQEKNKFFILKKIGRINKKLRIGMLKGNRFNIKLDEKIIDSVDYFINYYDIQRIKVSNIKKGKKLLFSTKKPSKKENLLIDSYLSYLWNESLKLFLRTKLKGINLAINNAEFFVPYSIEIDKLPKFWTVLGYKVKLEDSKPYYEEILKQENLNIEDITSQLKKRKIKGDYRRLYEKVEDFKVYNNWVSFYLNKGAYATMLLKFLYAKNVIFKP